MSESNLDLILRTRREGEAPQQAVQDLQEMRTGLTDLEKSMAGTRSTIGGLDRDITAFGTNLGSTSDLLNGLGINIPVSPMQAFGMAVQTGTNFIKEAVTEYADYVDEISKMSAFTGMTTESMSRLYQVADDLRIPINSLEMALKTMAQNGTVPSISGLQELSEKYLAIQDPLARAQFLTDNFGRSGQEMARIMLLGKDAIGQTTDAVEDWMIVTSKSKSDMEQYKQTIDKWDESMMSARFELATQVLPTLSNFMNAIIDTNNEINNSGSAWMRYIPILGAVQELWVGIRNVVRSFSIPSIPSGYGGGRASGGDIAPGMTYKVGEREVEYINSPIPATVTPASQGGGVTIVLQYSPVLSTASEREVAEALKPAFDALMRRRGM